MASDKLGKWLFSRGLVTWISVTKRTLGRSKDSCQLVCPYVNLSMEDMRISKKVDGNPVDFCGRTGSFSARDDYVTRSEKSSMASQVEMLHFNSFFFGIIMFLYTVFRKVFSQTEWLMQCVIQHWPETCLLLPSPSRSDSMGTRP